MTCSTRCVQWSIRGIAAGPVIRLVSILALAAVAVVAGARSSVAVGRWAAHAPAGVLAALGVRVDPRDGRFVVPPLLDGLDLSGALFTIAWVGRGLGAAQGSTWPLGRPPY